MSPDWYFPVGRPRAGYLKVRRALDNLEAFIRDVRRHPCERYPYEPKDDVADLQVPLEPAPAVVEMRNFTFNHHLHGGNDVRKYVYSYTDHRNVLNYQGKLRLNYERVIFTPSKGRCDIALLRWSGEEKLVNTLGVVVVPSNELTKYSERWGANRLIIGVDHECVSEVCYHIIQLARHWGRETFWMIDDSVPTSMLYQKTWGNQDPILCFDHVLQAIEEMPGQHRFRNAVLIVLTSTFSIQNLSQNAERYVINNRTPTSCVFVCLNNVPEELNYERQLPSKKNVIFAAQLIVAGRDVIIDRHIHFEDYPYRVGGCMQNPFANDGAPAHVEALAQQVEELNIGQ